MFRYVISSLPGKSRLNPYVDLFFDALEPYGVVLYPELKVSFGWIRRHHRQVDALLFHWPEWIWRPAWIAREHKCLLFNWQLASYGIAGIYVLRVCAVAQRLVSMIVKSWKLARFFLFLLYTKALGVKVFWTVHNERAHENWQIVDIIGFWIFAKHADLIIVHSSTCKKAISRDYHPKGIVITMPHGNYVGAYPQADQRESILFRLGLNPALPVAGCLGMLRDYKGFDIACQAIKLLEGRVQLLCAGEAGEFFAKDAFEEIISNTPASVLVARRMSDQELVDFCSACDVILLPYSRATTSGALLLALSMGRGVVAHDLPYFREIFGEDPFAGILVAPGEVNDFARAIDKYLSIPHYLRESAATALANRFSWAELVIPVVNAIRDIV